MILNWKAPEAPDSATEAKMEAGGFTVVEYFVSTSCATGPTALRVAHLVHRLNVNPGAAATLAGLVFGEVLQ